MKQKELDKMVDSLKKLAVLDEEWVNDEPLNLLMERLAIKIANASNEPIPPFTINEVAYIKKIVFKIKPSEEYLIPKGSGDLIKNNFRIKLNACIETYIKKRKALKKPCGLDSIFSSCKFTTAEMQKLESRKINYLNDLLAYTKEDLSRVFGENILKKAQSMQNECYRKFICSGIEALQFMDDYMNDEKERNVSYFVNQVGVTEHFARNIAKANYNLKTIKFLKPDVLSELNIIPRENLKKIKAFVGRRKNDSVFKFNHGLTNDVIGIRQAKIVDFETMFSIHSRFNEIIESEEAFSGEFQTLICTLCKLKESEASLFLNEYAVQNNLDLNTRKINRIIKLLKENNVFIDGLIEDEFLDFDFCDYFLLRTTISAAKKEKGISSNELSCIILGRCNNHYIDDVINGAVKPSVSWLEKVCEVLDIDFETFSEETNIKKRGTIYVSRDIENNDYNHVIINGEQIISDDEYRKVIKNSILRKKCHDIVSGNVKNIKNEETLTETNVKTENDPVVNSVVAEEPEFLGDESLYYSQYSRRELQSAFDEATAENDVAKENLTAMNDKLNSIENKFASLLQQLNELSEERVRLQEEISNESAKKYFAGKTAELIDEEIYRRVRDKKSNQ